MRIISGYLKGRRLNAPDNLPVRPTTDMAKESLFNILNNRVEFEELEVLDLFGGIGGISFEFISRGVKSLHCIEMNNACIAFIKATMDRLEIDNMQVFKQDAFLYPAKCKSTYDLIYADPPYQAEEISILPDLIFQNSLLKEDGYFILEHGKQHNFSAHPHFMEERKYGKVHFSFFQ